MQAVNHQNMSDTNKFILLKEVATRGSISRIALSKLTGLSKMAVTILIGEYIENGIVRECGRSHTTAGRKPMLLEVVPDSLLTLGISVGRDFLQVGIIDLKGRVVQSDHMPMTQIMSAETLLNSLIMLCNNVMSHAEGKNIWGIGVSSIGPLDLREGVIVNPPDFNGIGNVHIVEKLREHFDLPIYMENDMCVSALAELYFGKGQAYDNFVYIGISAGIGGGIIIDKRLYNGTRGLAALIGHIVVEVDGIRCECGNRGCLENYGSTRAAVRYAKEQGMDKNLTWLTLLEQAGKGDETCRRSIERMYKYLETAVTNVVSLLDTQCIFLGGDIWFGAEYFISRLNEALKKKMFASEIGEPVPVLLSQFPGNAAFIGTAALVMENNVEYQRKMKELAVSQE